MNLSYDDVDEYIDFLTPDAPDLADRKDRARGRFATDATYRRRIHVARGTDGQLAAAIGAHPWMGELWQATLRATSATALREIHRSWLADIGDLDPQPCRLLCRLDAPSGLDVLTELGWRRDGERFEFRTSVADLPAVEGSPLNWRDLDDVGLDLAAEVFHSAGQGPDWDEGDDARLLIDGYLSRTDALTTIEVGCLDDTPMAFIAATVEPADGWCTLTFMGLAESHRGQALGRWVHLRGFEILRRTGGVTYHGGTSAQNLPMRRLFERHGCQPHRHMEEWTLELA